MYINDSYYEYEQVAGVIRQARDWLEECSDLDGGEPRDLKLIEAWFVGHVPATGATSADIAEAAKLRNDSGSELIKRPYDPAWASAGRTSRIQLHLGPPYGDKAGRTDLRSVWETFEP